MCKKKLFKEENIMQETPPILRRNIKHNRLIQSSIVICLMLLMTLSVMQVSKETEKVEMLEETVELSAGVIKHMSEFLKEVEVEPVLEARIKKVDKVIVTVPRTEPEILYKSIEEIEISRDMDLTKTLGISREDFCELLADFKYDYNGFYNANAGLIWDLAQKYQVNELFVCGVFGLESYYGSSKNHIATHNYGSIMNRDGKLKQYADDADGIEANFELFANCYLAPEGKYYKGVTLDSIGDTYCPPTPGASSWSDKVYSCMQLFLKK